MLSSQQIQSHLDGLAAAIQASFLGTNGSEGWGQFLQAPRQHRQVGQYGTCAGVICLSMAGQHSSPNCRTAVEQLGRWWKVRETDQYAKRIFAQNTRMAFQALALRLSASNGIPEEGAHVEREICRRQISGGGWGNWYINDQLHDPTPRLFPTAIVVMALLLFRRVRLDEQGNVAIRNAMDFLGTRLRSSKNFPVVERAALVAALRTGESFAENVQVLPEERARLTRGLWSRARESSYGHYFFHYQYPEGEGSLAFKQDYLFVPPELLIGIAGFLRGSPGLLRLEAERLLGRIGVELNASEGLYRIEEGEPASTIDQAWVAIVLGLARELAASKAPIAGWLARQWYSLTRIRRGNLITETVIPSIALILVTIADAMAGKMALSLTENAVIALSTVTIAGLYGPKVLRKLVRVEQ